MLDKNIIYQIAAYKEISAQISELEKSKKRLSSELLQAFDNAGIDNFDGLQVVERTTETIKKGTIPEKLWDHYKTVNTSRFIKKVGA